MNTKKNWKKSNLEDFDEKSNVYFDKKTEDKIIEFKYGKLNRFQKNKLYEVFIYPVFTELISIMIHRYKFYYTGLDVETLTQVLNVHMYNQLETCNFNPENGSAYSYFSRMAKNKLIQMQDKNQKTLKKYSFDSINDDDNFNENRLSYEEEDFEMLDFLNKFIYFVEENFDNLFEKDDEIHIAKSIINIMKDDKLVIKNKKLLYYMIKEQGDDRNYKINKVINIMKEHYYRLKNQYIEEYRVSIELELEEEIEDEIEILNNYNHNDG